MPHDKPWLDDDALEAALFDEPAPTKPSPAYEYRLTDKPDSALRVIAPDCNEDEVMKALMNVFGARLISMERL